MRQLIFVLGMSRSGTSALTRSLSLAGAALPENLLAETSGNVKGHWEPQDAIDLNDAFLRARRSDYYDPTLRVQRGELFVDSPEGDAFVAKICTFLDSYATDRPLVVKDPRIVAVAPFWFRAAARSGRAVRCAISIRNPREVAGSLAERDGASFDFSNVLWLKYNLLAERVTRRFPRVFVDYGAILGDWRRELERTNRALELDLHARAPESIDDFLDRSLNRNEHLADRREPPLLPLTQTVYGELRRAARDAGGEAATFDDAFAMFSKSALEASAGFDGFERAPDAALLGAWDRIGDRVAARLRALA